MKKSQNEMILKYLLVNRGGITSLEALKMFGTFRLAARIKELKMKGHRIEKEIIRVKTKFGFANVANYKLQIFKRGDK